jgi:RND family efflux transporter MFP subunit
MAANFPQVLTCLLLLAIMVGSAGCQDKPAPAAALPAEVTVCRPLQRQISDAVEYTGTTTAPESVDVRARVTGFLEKVLFEPRARVSAGNAIFEIDARPFKAALDRAEADVLTKKAQLAKAEFDAERIIELAEKGVAAPDELSNATSNRDAFRAAHAAAKAIAQQAALELSWCTVTAPISGRISRNYIDTGNIVTADQTVLARITNDDSLYAYFNCSERDLLTIRERARQQTTADGAPPTSMPEVSQAKWPMFLGMMTEKGFPHAGVMDYTSPEVDASTGTLQVRGVFPNSENLLLPGLFVRLRVPIGKPYPAMVVSERALGSDQGQRYLLVVNDKNIVEYRPVSVGTLDSGLRVITQGVGESDWVIVSGIQRVRPGATVKPIQSAMPADPANTSSPTSAPVASAKVP